MMNGLTDVHQHLLWGIDDGPKDAKTMHAMLRAANEQSIRRVFATPHACPGFKPFDMALYEERLAQAQAYCTENGLEVEVLPGAEIEWTYHTVQALSHGRLPTLGDTDCALIELWHSISWAQVYDAAERLLAEGILPLFAHVERYRCFVLNPKEAIRLRNRCGVAYQVNAATILGGGGLLTRRFVSRMLDEQAIDAVASDAHNCQTRPQLLGKAYEALCARCGDQYADALVSFREVCP